MVHAKKIRTEFFEKVVAGKKPYEIRYNDCNYKQEDFLALNEINGNGEYTGRCSLFLISDVFQNEEFIKKSHVILTIIPCYINLGEIGSCASVYNSIQEMEE